MVQKVIKCYILPVSFARIGGWSHRLAIIHRLLLLTWGSDDFHCSLFVLAAPQSWRKARFQQFNGLNPCRGEFCCRAFFCWSQHLRLILKHSANLTELLREKKRKKERKSSLQVATGEKFFHTENVTAVILGYMRDAHGRGRARCRSRVISHRSVPPWDDVADSLSEKICRPPVIHSHYLVSSQSRGPDG